MSCCVGQASLGVHLTVCVLCYAAIYIYGSQISGQYFVSFFDVLLTVHLSTILATDQLNAQILVFF